VAIPDQPPTTGAPPAPATSCPGTPTTPRCKPRPPPTAAGH
jgi:hypothetical protein